MDEVISAQHTAGSAAADISAEVSDGVGGASLRPIHFVLVV